MMLHNGFALRFRAVFDGFFRSRLGLLPKLFHSYFMELNLTHTLILLFSSLCFSFICGYMGARPVSLKGPRMVPWRFLMLVFFSASIVLLVHVLTLLGLKQNQPFY